MDKEVVEVASDGALDSSPRARVSIPPSDNDNRRLYECCDVSVVI